MGVEQELILDVVELIQAQDCQLEEEIKKTEKKALERKEELETTTRTKKHKRDKKSTERGKKKVERSRSRSKEKKSEFKLDVKKKLFGDQESGDEACESRRALRRTEEAASKSRKLIERTNDHLGGLKSGLSTMVQRFKTLKMDSIEGKVLLNSHIGRDITNLMPILDQFDEMQEDLKRIIVETKEELAVCSQSLKQKIVEKYFNGDGTNDHMDEEKPEVEFKENRKALSQVAMDEEVMTPQVTKVNAVIKKKKEVEISKAKSLPKSKKKRAKSTESKGIKVFPRKRGARKTKKVTHEVYIPFLPKSDRSRSRSFKKKQKKSLSKSKEKSLKSAKKSTNRRRMSSNVKVDLTLSRRSKRRESSRLKAEKRSAKETEYRRKELALFCKPNKLEEEMKRFDIDLIPSVAKSVKVNSNLSKKYNFSIKKYISKKDKRTSKKKKSKGKKNSGKKKGKRARSESRAVMVTKRSRKSDKKVRSKSVTVKKKALGSMIKKKKRSIQKKIRENFTEVEKTPVKNVYEKNKQEEYRNEDRGIFNNLTKKSKDYEEITISSTKMGITCSITSNNPAKLTTPKSAKRGPKSTGAAPKEPKHSSFKKSPEKVKSCLFKPEMPNLEKEQDFKKTFKRRFLKKLRKEIRKSDGRSKEDAMVFAMYVYGRVEKQLDNMTELNNVLRKVLALIMVSFVLTGLEWQER